MGKKSLSDLVEINEDERLACSLCGLWGTSDVQNNTVVVLTPQGSLKSFNLDPKRKSATDCPLPQWAKDVFITMHRSGQRSGNRQQHNNAKRGRQDNFPRNNNNNRGHRGNKRRRQNFDQN